MCNEMKYELWFGSGSIDTRSYNQYFMNSYTDRLQAYAVNFDDATQTETKLYDISEIDKVPVYAINAEFDGDCETPEDFKTMMQDVPSFKDQTVLIDQKHGDIFLPTPEKGQALSDALLGYLDTIYGGSENPDPQPDDNTDFSNA